MGATDTIQTGASLSEEDRVGLERVLDSLEKQSWLLFMASFFFRSWLSTKSAPQTISTPETLSLAKSAVVTRHCVSLPLQVQKTAQSLEPTASFTVAKVFSRWALHHAERHLLQSTGHSRFSTETMKTGHFIGSSCPRELKQLASQVCFS